MRLIVSLLLFTPAVLPFAIPVLAKPISEPSFSPNPGSAPLIAPVPPLTPGTITASKNLARQAGERANGGISNYRAEAAMHGPALEAPYRDGGDRWIFTFQGGAPDSQRFTVETEVSVHKVTLETTVLYNGPIRTAALSTVDDGGDRSPDAQLSRSPEPNPAPTAPEPNSVPVVAPTTLDAPLAAPGDVTTAKNYARQTAEKLNGGLANYRAEAAMHGPALEAPYQDKGDRWVFTFLGGAPGAVNPSIESEVAVDKTTLLTSVIYNGPIRTAALSTGNVGTDRPSEAQLSQSPEPNPAPIAPESNSVPVVGATTPFAPLTEPGITTAKNYARQAAERLNGGLANYRAEVSMHGPALDAPYKDEGDRWVFTFLGGPPDAVNPSIESEVVVDKSTFETTVAYNGPIRPVSPF